MRLLLTLALLVFVHGCASALTPEEKAIGDRAATLPIANSITVSELSEYKEIGPVSCSRDTTNFSSGGADEMCRADLRLNAANDGGDLIVLEARDTAPCSSGNHLCIFMHGRTYKKTSAKK